MRATGRTFKLEPIMIKRSTCSDPNCEQSKFFLRISTVYTDFLLVHRHRLVELVSQTLPEEDNVRLHDARGALSGEQRRRKRSLLALLGIQCDGDGSLLLLLGLVKLVAGARVPFEVKLLLRRGRTRGLKIRVIFEKSREIKVL